MYINILKPCPKSNRPLRITRDSQLQISTTNRPGDSPCPCLLSHEYGPSPNQKSAAQTHDIQDADKRGAYGAVLWGICKLGEGLLAGLEFQRDQHINSYVLHRPPGPPGMLRAADPHAPRDRGVGGGGHGGTAAATIPEKNTILFQNYNRVLVVIMSQPRIFKFRSNVATVKVAAQRDHQKPDIESFQLGERQLWHAALDCL